YTLSLHDALPISIEEEEFFESLARQPGHSCIRGRYGPYWHICARLTTHVDGWPMDGGPNPAWEKLAERLGEHPIAWAKKQKQKRSEERRVGKECRARTAADHRKRTETKEP